MPNNLLQMHLKRLQKEQFKKQKKQLVISLVIIFAKKNKDSPHNSSETDSQTEEKSVEIRRNMCISPEKRRPIIDDLRLM